MPDVVREAWADSLRPEPSLLVSDWADRYRMLSGGAEPGRWRTDRTPYLREPSDRLSVSDPVQEIVAMKGTQLGFSEMLCNWVGYVMHHAAGPMLIVQPGLELAKRFSRQRVDTMIKDTPALAELSAGSSMSRAEAARSTMMMKEFVNGGILALTGANSSSGLRSMPVRYLGMDEVDVYPGDVGDEGGPVEVAKKRTATFTHRRKVLIFSSPTVRGTSKIESEFATTDQRYYFVPCNACDARFIIKWALVEWDNRDPSTVRVVCSECGFHHREHHKHRMLLRGEWRPTATSSSPLRVGYHLSGLYSPWVTWEEQVAEFLAAGDDPSRLKPWVNSVLGETWEEKGDAPEWERLYERREHYDIGTVPAGGLVLTAGVDAQRNRLEASVWAWGVGFESWLVDHIIIPGSPADPGTLEKLEAILAQRWPHANGGSLRVERLALDTGDGAVTQLLYRWCRRQDQQRVMAIKGVATSAHPVTVSDVDITDQRGVKGTLKLWSINVSQFKSEFYAHLRLPVPTENDGGVYPPGFVHLPLGMTADFAQQLCAEQLVTKMTRGYPKQEWQQTGRNEALDCRGYARAALYVLGADSAGPRFWADARRILLPESLPQPMLRPAPPPRRSGWMSDFGRMR